MYAAELAGGMATDVSIPSGARWNPQGMTVEYIAKAKTDLKVICDAANMDFSQSGAVVAPVSAYDKEGTKCFVADITMNIKLT